MILYKVSLILKLYTKTPDKLPKYTDKIYCVLSP